ncbi:cell wall protein [Corallococcus carmarthensis]|uniref:cell wall protein n=1 Tax=Corallococcus carmarthensis TaxID=2316728 RepID=UPI001FC9AC20|nr:cell wall protein [Corallococcus carmarthensis]
MWLASESEAAATPKHFKYRAGGTARAARPLPARRHDGGAITPNNETKVATKTETKSSGGLLELAERLEEVAQLLRDTVAKLGGVVTSAPAAKAPLASAAKPSKPGTAKAAQEDGTRVCAIKGCGKPSRTKGYCAAHYQKLRNLEKTKRRPADWVDDAKPNTVEDVLLPRGRAASKALAEASAQ